MPSICERRGARAALGIGILSSCLHAVDPSLCINALPGCPVTDGMVRFAVQLGAAEVLIVSGEFYVQYDPGALEFLRIEPGAACDAASPFVLDLGAVVDATAGLISFRVSVDEAGGSIGTPGPDVMACVTFIQRAVNASDVCLVEPGFPQSSRLLDFQHLQVPIDNSADCPAALPLLACTTVQAPGSTCICATGSADCAHLDAPCTLGTCAPGLPARCIPSPRNEGGPCDDADVCTLTDRCLDGHCIGTDCPNPSLCVVGEPGCPVLNGLSHFRVELGEGDAVIAGGQFSVRYDPSALEFVSIRPGNMCDPDSPFLSEILTIVDESMGEIRFAVSVGPTGTGTTGPATLACLSFVVRSATPHEVCLFDGGNPFPARLSDAAGNAVPIDNADTCHALQLPPVLSCTTSEVSTSCACESHAADCTHLNEDCRTGVCNGDPAQCTSVAANDGQPCNDGIPCTTEDLCTDGVCRGSNCTDPSLCMEVLPGCPVQGGLIRARVVLGDSEPVVTEAQFTVEYDPALFERVEIEPGIFCDSSSPFVLELYENVDAVAGRIRYAVTIHPFVPGGGKIEGPVALACLTFRVIAETGTDELCILAGSNPFYTRLGDANGFPVGIYNGEDCPTGDGAGHLACANLSLSSSCVCPEGSPDCSEMSGPCRRGFCTGLPPRCQTEFINEALTCQGNSPCGNYGVCRDGTCVTADCPQNPSLCVEQDGECVAPGVNRFRIRLGYTQALVVGAQFELRYDPAFLEFKQIVAGAACDPASPFVIELYENVDPVAGIIRYAVIVNITDPDHGTHGPATLACITFNRLIDADASEVCIVTGENPFYTRITDKGGHEVVIENSGQCPSDDPDIVACEPLCRIPTLSHWGLAILANLLLIGGKLRTFGSPFRESGLRRL
jgi:hypothetical protein